MFSGILTCILLLLLLIQCQILLLNDSVGVTVFARWRLNCFNVIIAAYFWNQCSTSVDCLLNYYILILFSFHYDSLIIVNDIETFVCIDDIVLLKVTFLLCL